MESSDITIILLTANRVPKKWAEFHQEKLLEAVGSSPLITISREPLNWGVNLPDTEPYHISNIYFQLLRGAKRAATDYIGVAEDDTLYPKEHFEFRPPPDTFAYNMNRFGVFTWGRPTYFWKDRMSNSTLIAPRKLTIEALEERFNKYPSGTPAHFTGELGRPNIEDKLGVKRRKSMWFSTEVSVVRIDHEFGVDRLARTHRKGKGILQAYDIPHWGKAEDLVKKFV
ncbi:hypothetical protein HY469_04600 [Candidatus Roizmanbacteria bacterium]|nr:hypothetical protein [Candidatus Roizmanbacteria bacterium]